MRADCCCATLVDWKWSHKQLVFRGTATDEVSDKPEKNMKKVDDATKKMFKNFPPEPKVNKEEAKKKEKEKEKNPDKK